MPNSLRHTITSLKSIGNLGLQLRFWVAGSVTALAYYCQGALASPSLAKVKLGPVPLSTWGIIFLSTLALYNLDGSLDARPGTLRTRLHWALTTGSGVLLLPLLLTLPQGATALVASGLLLCSLYAVPWGPARQNRRLKSVPGLKAPFIGCAVAIAVVYFPLLTRSPESPRVPDSLTLCGLLACLCTINALLFDIPDQAEDHQQQVPTLPTRWGIKPTLLSCRLMSLGTLLSAVLLLERPLPLVCLALALLVACSLIDTKTAKSTVAFWVDGALMLPALVLLLQSSV